MNQNSKKLAGVLFDLDGTVADTAPDLAYALNETLKSHNKPTLSFEQIRPVVSHGGLALIKLGFGFGAENKNYESTRQQLLDIYLENITRQTQLFSGMNEVLIQLENADIPWGIVTNKPGWLTNPLMAALNLTERAACIVSGDTTSKSKPHPQPLFHACELANLNPANCLYVGDAERDIAAGRAAGMKTVAALFGYLLDDDDPSSWGADFSINQPLELLKTIEIIR